MLKKVLRVLDIFGSPVRFTFENQDEHNTSIGGLMSVMINLIGMSYGLYMFVCWQQGYLVPTIQETQLEIKETRTINFDYNPLEINIETWSEDSRTKYIQFTEADNVFTSVTSHMINKTQILGRHIVNQSNRCLNKRGQPGICMKGNLSDEDDVQIQQGTDEGSKSLLLYVLPCDQVHGYNCTKKNKITEVNGSNIIRLRFVFYCQQYDIATGKINLIPKQFAFFSSLSQVATIQFIVKLQTIKVSDQFIFSKNKEIQIISDIQTITSFLTDAATERWGIARAMIHMDTLYSQVKVSNVSITQIMAQIGSLYSALFLLQILFVNFAHKQMQNYLTLEVLKIYYPDLAKRKIYQNYIGQIRKIQGLDNQETKNLLEELIPLSKRYLDILNLFRQIKILQAAIQKLLSSQQILECINKGDDLQIGRSLKNSKRQYKNIPLIELFSKQLSTEQDELISKTQEPQDQVENIDVNIAKPAITYQVWENDDFF